MSKNINKFDDKAIFESFGEYYQNINEGESSFFKKNGFIKFGNEWHQSLDSKNVGNVELTIADDILTVSIEEPMETTYTTQDGIDQIIRALEDDLVKLLKTGNRRSIENYFSYGNWDEVNESFNETKIKHNVKVGQKIKVERHRGIFIDAVVDDVIGNRISYTAVNGDFGILPYDSPKLDLGNESLNEDRKTFLANLKVGDVVKTGEEWEELDEKNVGEISRLPTNKDSYFLVRFDRWGIKRVAPHRIHEL